MIHIMSIAHIQCHLLLLRCFTRITEYNEKKNSSIGEIGYTLLKLEKNKSNRFLLFFEIIQAQFTMILSDNSIQPTQAENILYNTYINSGKEERKRRRVHMRLI